MNKPAHIFGEDLDLAALEYAGAIKEFLEETAGPDMGRIQ